MAKSVKRLYGPALLTNAAADLYTAGSTVSAVARVIWLFNEDSSARTVTLSIGADAAGTRFLMTYSVAALSPYRIDGPFTLGPSEKFQGYADVASKVTITISGEEYSAN